MKTSLPHLLLALSLGTCPPLHAEPTTKNPATDPPAAPPAAVSSLGIHDIAGFDSYPKQIQSLVQSSLALTRLELRYLYGSHDPAKGGMDCSGTIYHALMFQGLKDVPRQSDDMCRWVEKNTQLHLTPTATKLDHAEFSDLKPGDLLFWTDTAETTRKLPVTHVMIYLGKLKKNGKPVVFGSSDGRTYEGQRRSGVSVFDFHIPAADSPKRLHGYGPAPGLVPVQIEKKAIIAGAPPATTVKPAPPASATPAAPKEEVRKAVAAVPEAKPQPPPEVKPAPAAKPKASSPTSSVTAKPKSIPAKKPAAVPVKKKAPPPPPKSQVERTVNQAVDSVRRFFRR